MKTVGREARRACKNWKFCALRGALYIDNDLLAAFWVVCGRASGNSVCVSAVVNARSEQWAVALESSEGTAVARGFEAERPALVAVGLHARLGAHASRVRPQRRELLAQRLVRVRVERLADVPEGHQREVRPRQLHRRKGYSIGDC